MFPPLEKNISSNCRGAEASLNLLRLAERREGQIDSFAADGHLADQGFLLRRKPGDLRELGRLLMLGVGVDRPERGRGHFVSQLADLLRQLAIFRIVRQQRLPLDQRLGTERVGRRFESPAQASRRPPNGSVERNRCRRARSATSRLVSTPPGRDASNQCS